MLVGRENEIDILENYFDSNESSFIALYGRRRIGKTYLINELFKDRITFKHTGIYQGTKKEQLCSFLNSLTEYGYKKTSSINDWFEAFECLKDLIRGDGHKKKVIFLDEIAWMHSKGSDLLKAFESFWNGWANARNDVMLIICSSATSWIINNIVHSKGGLYNRITRQIYLQPFTLGECEKYVSQRNLTFTKKQIVEIYMTIGGVPYYWNYLKKGQSVPQFIDDCFFKEDAPLKGEYKYIFSSLFNKPNEYEKIIESLSRKICGLTRSEILHETKSIDNGDFSQRLEDLKNCGFIREYSPITYKKKSVVYQISDPFVIFHLHFLTKKTNDENFWVNQINTSQINSWKGLAFERICLLHLNSIKKAMGISGVYSAVYPWHCSSNDDENIYGSQIDMIIERKDDIINIFEIKYYDMPYAITSDYFDSLLRKKHDFCKSTKTKSAIHLGFITINGLKSNAYSKEIQTSIEIEDLFL